MLQGISVPFIFDTVLPLGCMWSIREIGTGKGSTEVNFLKGLVMYVMMSGECDYNESTNESLL